MKWDSQLFLTVFKFIFHPIVIVATLVGAGVGYLSVNKEVPKCIIITADIAMKREFVTPEIKQIVGVGQDQRNYRDYIWSMVSPEIDREIQNHLWPLTNWVTTRTHPTRLASIIVNLETCKADVETIQNKLKEVLRSRKLKSVDTLFMNTRKRVAERKKRFELYKRYALRARERIQKGNLSLEASVPAITLNENLESYGTILESYRGFLDTPSAFKLDHIGANAPETPEYLGIMVWGAVVGLLSGLSIQSVRLKT